MLRTVPVIMVLAVVVAACTPDASDPTTSTSVGPIPSTSSTTTTSQPPDGFGGTVKVGIHVAPASLNPFSETASSETGTIGNAVWATVYDVDPETGDRVADNVTGMPSQTPGGIVDNGDGTITVQYQVARRATWSDGTPMTGADLAFTAEALRDQAISGNPAVDPIMASVVETDSVEQVAWITYSERSLMVEDALWIILPAHAVEGESLRTANGVDWPSGGPFMIAGDVTSLVRNPNYWKTDDEGRQLPYADALRFVENFGTGAVAFASRSVDVVSLDPTQDNLSTVQDLESEGAMALVTAAPIIEHITFNLDETRLGVNPSSFNTSLVYRTAIAHAIDRQSLLDEAGVPWVPAAGLLDPSGDAWDRYTFDSAEARSLVASLEATSEPSARLSTTVNSDDRPAVANALTASFAPIGVDYKVDLQDSILLYQSSLPDGSYDLGMWAWVNDGSYTKRLEVAALFDPTVGDGSFSRWAADGSEASIRYSELLATASMSIDRAEFEAALTEAEEILAEEIPILPLFRRTTLAAVWVDTVTGVQGSGRDDGLTWNIESWQVAGA